MLANIRKRLGRKHLDIKESEDDDKDDLHAFTPPANYIKISQGKIQLVHPSKPLENEASDAPSKKDTELLECRIAELEEALLRLQEKVNNSQCGSPTFEKELREQLENMNRVMKSKERKQMQTFRDHKVLQTRFARQESLLHTMQQENKALQLRIRQYEHCLDDVMRKVVDAIVAEDNLREEVSLLKSRVRDLEAQNAALSASPARGRDEGYCTMSSGQPQPSNGHLEDLPEEPEQWLLHAEPCSTEMEDWSMSQEELAVITLEDEREQQQLQQQQQQQQQQRRLQQQQQQRRNGEHDWLWSSNDFLNSTMAETDSASDGITQLLQQKLVYSEDEEVACTEFTNDFYKLVNIHSSSARSLYSYIEGDTDDEDDDDDNDSSLSGSNVRLRRHAFTSSGCLQPPSPTPSEAGRAQVTSCSSSESDELCNGATPQALHVEPAPNTHSDIEIEDVQLAADADVEVARLAQQPIDETKCIEQIIKTEMQRAPAPTPPPPPHLLVKSKSTLDEDEPSCILRNNQRREIESSVVRSGSVNCSLAYKLGATGSHAAARLQDRVLQRPANSWRRSNGWKRVTSPTQAPTITPLVAATTNSTALVSPKKETKLELPKSFQAATTKMQPTRIPTSIASANSHGHAQHHHQQQQQQAAVASKQQQLNANAQSPSTRKSKIPPPVPVRRAYAS